MVMNRIIKPTLILAAIAFIASLALSHINRITRDKIEQRILQRKEEALQRVLPVSLGYQVIAKDKKAVIDGKEFVYTIAERQDGENKLFGYAFLTTKNGYSGAVKMMVGVDHEGKIIAISIIQQSETPGLGARSKEVPSTETFFGHFFGNSNHVSSRTENSNTSWFEEQFAGIDTNVKIGILKKGEWRKENTTLASELREKNSVSAITGATITTKTVTDSIESSMRLLHKAIELENKAVEEKTK